MLKEKCKDHASSLEIIREEEMESDMFRKYHAWYGSVFYVLQKINAAVQK
jgi:hypothetical protein